MSNAQNDRAQAPKLNARAEGGELATKGDAGALDGAAPVNLSPLDLLFTAAREVQDLKASSVPNPSDIANNPNAQTTSIYNPSTNTYTTSTVDPDTGSYAQTSITSRVEEFTA